ncbi:hypothetical protein [Dyadobacter aurulentus]|uniref:hypothetical protein n=1 Tax=Dyadobacter sp. UC 10 TaxID=2605428 RepID=UPI0011F15015|nr:hypothetical protein [Dyadobacter sp. UC 10]KAA0991031.1 hypothetical protein FXO21_13120 [Dyadobacter sp. UC 10]
MKFDDLYQKTIKYYPTSIDISDGKFLEETNGFRFDNLSNAWDLAESYAENEWQDLLIWTIFGYLHNKARSLFTSKESEIMTLSTVIDIEDLEMDFLSDLQEEGYEDMLKEYLK